MLNHTTILHTPFHLEILVIVGNSDRDGLSEIHLLQPKVCIRPNVCSSVGVECTVSHRAKHTLSLMEKPVLSLPLVHVATQFWNQIMLWGTFLRSRDFLAPEVHRSKAETHHARLTASSQHPSWCLSQFKLFCLDCE